MWEEREGESYLLLIGEHFPNDSDPHPCLHKRRPRSPEGALRGHTACDQRRRIGTQASLGPARALSAGMCGTILSFSQLPPPPDPSSTPPQPHTHYFHIPTLQAQYSEIQPHPCTVSQYFSNSSGCPPGLCTHLPLDKKTAGTLRCVAFESLQV